MGKNVLFEQNNGMKNINCISRETPSPSSPPPTLTIDNMINFQANRKFT